MARPLILGCLLVPLLLTLPNVLAEPTRSGGGTEGGWVAFELVGHGSLPLSWRLANSEDPASFGQARWYDGKLHDVWTGIRMGSLVDVGVQTPAMERVSVTTGGNGMSIYSGMHVNGRATHVFWVAGDVREWSWSVGSHPNVTVVSVEQGSTSHLLTARDFAGGVGANVGGYFAGARANALGETSIDVTRGLVGTTVSWGQDVLVREGPDGRVECTAITVNAVIFAGSTRSGCLTGVSGAGTHRFAHTGAGYGILNLDEFYFTGVDYWPQA